VEELRAFGRDFDGNKRAVGLRLLVVRAVLGWFGGHGPEGTGQFFESVGVRPGRCFALTEAGSGPISLDRALGTGRCGTAWALGQLAAGAAGSAVISKLAESRASAEVEAREEPADRAEASAHAPV
jgi:hypothetical protein